MSNAGSSAPLPAASASRPIFMSGLPKPPSFAGATTLRGFGSTTVEHDFVEFQEFLFRYAARLPINEGTHKIDGMGVVGRLEIHSQTIT